MVMDLLEVVDEIKRAKGVLLDASNRVFELEGIVNSMVSGVFMDGDGDGVMKIFLPKIDNGSKEFIEVRVLSDGEVYFGKYLLKFSMSLDGGFDRSRFGSWANGCFTSWDLVMSNGDIYRGCFPIGVSIEEFRVVITLSYDIIQ